MLLCSFFILNLNETGVFVLHLHFSNVFKKCSKKQSFKTIFKYEEKVSHADQFHNFGTKWYILKLRYLVLAKTSCSKDLNRVKLSFKSIRPQFYFEIAGLASAAKRQEIQNKD